MLLLIDMSGDGEDPGMENIIDETIYHTKIQVIINRLLYYFPNINVCGSNWFCERYFVNTKIFREKYLRWY